MDCSTGKRWEAHSEILSRGHSHSAGWVQPGVRLGPPLELTVPTHAGLRPQWRTRPFLKPEALSYSTLRRGSLTEKTLRKCARARFFLALK